MTLTVLVSILLLGMFCSALKFRRVSALAYVVVATLFLMLGCGPIPAWLLGSLQSAYATALPIEWGKHNAIVLLGAGTERLTDTVEPGAFSYARIVAAVERYDDCRKTGEKCEVIVSGGDAAHTGAPEAAVYSNALLKLGVAEADIVLESESRNTWENARLTSEVLQRFGADRVVLVSSGIHLKRSMLYFAHFGVPATPVRADYLNARWSVLPLSYNFAVADFALQEYAGIARYHAYNALGQNPAPARTGG
ncbi:YdcF family protein [Achromobacter dolens]|uniref:YdcF family protein n=1 Tax=Achromobacter dolens TaxID=1287738 RepID=UPI001465EB08|nr:YdcF family protein [Achromobacter dolens]CAB3644633.1 hypothetical protein LMG26840_02334 [Achromobacter dolens]